MGIKNTINRMMGRTKTVIGLDIGHDSVKAVHLSGTLENLELVRYGMAPVHRPKGKGEGESELAAMLEALNMVMNQLGMQSGSVCTSVSGESVIVRPISMPYFSADNEEQFQMAVRGEARDFIPFEMDDVVFDYQRLGEKANREGGKALEVLIVAVKKELIESRLRMIEQVGLEPAIIDVDSIALVNAVSAGSEVNPAEAVAVVNLGSRVTNIAIARNQMTRFTRDLAFAGSSITESIASEFEISFVEAEKMKKDYGLSLLNVTPEGGQDEAPDDESTATASMGVVQDLYEAIEDLKTDEEKKAEKTGAEEGSAAQNIRISEICEQVISDVVSEVKRSLLYYENQLDGEPIARVLLSGGTAKLKGIQDYFESMIDIPCEVVQPLKKIKSSMSEQEAEEKGPLLSVGLGLALRNVIGK
jgi:type IV pilus assembly protein PilM